MHAFRDAGLLHKAVKRPCLMVRGDAFAICAAGDLAFVRQLVLPGADSELLIKPAALFKGAGTLGKRFGVEPPAGQSLADDVGEKPKHRRCEQKMQKLNPEHHCHLNRFYSSIKTI